MNKLSVPKVLFIMFSMCELSSFSMPMLQKFKSFLAV